MVKKGMSVEEEEKEDNEELEYQKNGKGEIAPKDLPMKMTFDPPLNRELEYSNVPLDKVLVVSMIAELKDEYRRICKMILEAQREYLNIWLEWHPGLEKKEEQLEIQKKLLEELKGKVEATTENKSLWRRSKKGENGIDIPLLEKSIKWLRAEIKDIKENNRVTQEIEKCSIISAEYEYEYREAIKQFSAEKWLHYWLQTRRSVLADQVKRATDVINKQLEVEQTKVQSPWAKDIEDAEIHTLGDPKG